MAYEVIVVDDQSIPRQLFSLIVEQAEGYHLMYALDSASVASMYCARFSVDLVILDVVMKEGMNGLLAAERIKQVSPKTKIILVTSMPEVSYMKRAREIGVESFWYKETEERDLFEVMEKTMAGESIYPDTMPVLSMGQISSADFTPSELVVLREMTTGATNVAIAEKLFVDVSTVKKHISNMLQKTGFKNRTELAIEARVQGIVIGERTES
jgi:two-component system vancomycin resistance associated response regulator VraR